MAKFLKNLLMNEIPQDGGAGGSSAPNPAADVQALAKQMADEMFASQTEGLRKKNAELLGKMNDLKNQLKQFDGIDPEAVRNILSRFDNEEEQKLIAGGKFEELIERKTERMRKNHEQELKARDEQISKAQSTAKAFEQKVLANELRAAATKAGVHEFAIDDVLSRGRSIFGLSEDGSAVMVDSNGEIVMGKDGKSPATPLEWLEGLKESAPHWWPAKQNSQQSGKTFGFAETQQMQKMSPTERLKIARAGKY